MNPQDKELLLKDLCARLPYGVKVWYKYYSENVTANFATSIRLVDGEIHNLVIDRIEISVERFSPNNPIQRNKIIYLATTTDAKFNRQYQINNEAVFTEEELKKYIKKYFENKIH